MTNLATDHGALLPLVSDEITFSCEVEQAQNSLISSKSRVNSQPLQDGGCSLNSFINGVKCLGVSSHYTQLSYVDNSISIDKGTFLAKKPCSLNSDWVTRNKTGNEFLDLHVASFLEFINAKRKPKASIDMLDCVLANLLNAVSLNATLLYSLDTANYEARTCRKVVDYLSANGLVINVKGKANQYQKNQSWMIPTDKLKLDLERAKVRVELKRDASMVILRDSDKNEMSLNRVKARSPRLLRSMSNPVQDYNQYWLEHDVTLGGVPLVPFCRRIFNHSDKLDLGGRFYGASHMIISKEQRQFIQIDCSMTVEPDFKAMHMMMLYARCGIQLDPIKDDPYQLEGFDRKTVKIAMLRLVNSSCVKAFKACVTKSGNPKNKERVNQYREDLRRFIMRSSKGLEATNPTKPKVMDGFIDGMPDGIDGSKLLDSIIEKHKPIAHLLGAKNIGLELQNQDSEIMARTLSQLVAVDIPALPVHDSLICRVCDSDTVTNAMRLAYKAVTGFEGCVTLD